MDTLEQMKEQLRLLQDKLDRQTLVSERMLRAVVGHKVHALNRQALQIALVGVLGIPYCLWSFGMLHLSVPFQAVTVAFLALAVGYTWFSHRGLGSSSMSRASLCQVGQRVARMKLLYARWLRFSLPFLGIWLSWFTWEILQQMEYSMEYRVGILCGGAVGGLIGGFCGWLSYRRTQRLARAILDEIEGLDTTDGHLA